jgi:murein DD-endopeptidase MepM/ murein hydrolase activator NlpD
MMSRLPARWLAFVVTIALVLSAVGCDDSTPTPAQTPSAEPAVAATSAPTAPAARDSSQANPRRSPDPARLATASKYVFPVLGKASYAHSHHDYPAADIIAPCGETAVSPTDGTVLEVNRVDAYNRKINAGQTRGGLSISILGQDGTRFYGSHYSSIRAGIEPGVTVTAGQRIATVGRTGDAGACHVHFGLSPACARTGDWWIRRGVIWPWPYLDAWRAGTAKSPTKEMAAWQASHGCPAKPLVDP